LNQPKEAFVTKQNLIDLFSDLELPDGFSLKIVRFFPAEAIRPTCQYSTVSQWDAEGDMLIDMGAYKEEFPKPWPEVRFFIRYQGPRDRESYFQFSSPMSEDFLEELLSGRLDLKQWFHEEACNACRYALRTEYKTA
jgi:hypothetical protein